MKIQVILVYACNVFSRLQIIHDAQFDYLTGINNAPLIAVYSDASLVILTVIHRDKNHIFRKLQDGADYLLNLQIECLILTVRLKYSF